MGTRQPAKSTGPGPAPAGPARRTPSSDVRQNLVDAAAAVLERDGVAGLTVRAVAKQAGVAPMGVYNHLDGKDGLLTAVLDRGFADLTAAITPSDTAADEWSQLREAGLAYRRFALANPVTYGLMFGHRPIAYGDPDSVATDAFAVLLSLVIRGQRAGVVRAEEPVQIAQQIWSCVHGAVSLELAGDPGPVDTFLDYATLLDLLERGLRPT